MPRLRQAGGESASIPRDSSTSILIGHRMGGVGAAQGVDPGLGQPHVADVAGLDQVGDRPDCLLDGHGQVDPAQPVDVDVVGAQPQAVGESSRRRERRQADDRAIRRASGRTSR